MIIAGTVSAYLKLSIDDFRSNLQAAMKLLGQSSVAIAPVNAGLKGLELSAGSVSSMFLVMQQGMDAAFSSAQQSAANACTGMTSTLSVTAQEIKSGVLTPIRSLSAPLTSAMMEAGRGMEAGLRSRTPSIVAAARSIAAQVSSTVRSALKIASPSRVMRQIGSFTAEGLALGITDGIPRVAASAAAVARTVERSSAASLSFPGGFVPEYADGTAALRREGSAELAALSERMDRLLDYLYDTEPVLRVDGRTFGRMVREYS